LNDGTQQTLRLVAIDEKEQSQIDIENEPLEKATVKEIKQPIKKPL